jgi:serine/threonine protein kinase
MTTDPLSIGRFQVQCLLGRSPSHMVYLAWDPQSGHRVTVTTGLQGTDPRAMREQCQREWDISRRLSHPGIQKVLDRGQHPDFGPFLVKEYADGVDLSLLLQDRIPLQAALHLLIQLTLALLAAEEAGVVHGDVKPENIVVDIHGRLVLMDFHAGTRTDSGQGHPYASAGYAAPEIIHGGKPSARSDLFSFAVTAFQSLTGTMPFQGADTAAVFRATCDLDPIFPEGMPIAARMVFQNAFEKNPVERPQDLRLFMKRLIESLALPETQAKELLAFLGGGALEIRGLEPLLAKHIQLETTMVETSPCATRPLSFSQSKTGLVLKGGLGLLAVSLLGLLVWQMMRTVPKSPATTPTVQSVSEPAAAPAVAAQTPISRTISLRTEPPGATILLDGRSQGRSPLERLELQGSGTHQFVARLDGYREWTMAVSADESLPDPIRLEQVPPVASVITKKPAPKPPVKKPAKKGEFNLYEHLRKQEGQ